MMLKLSAYTVFYGHLIFMGVIFFGKPFLKPGLVDSLIVATVLSQIMFKICPFTTLEEFLFQSAKIDYAYKSWTKWIHNHYGVFGHVFSLAILWSVSELVLLAYCAVTQTPYDNYLINSFFIFL